ncbi:MAG: 3-oxoacyl-ACP reductase FabG [Deltaproteobacteria bacterium]|nr:3-oxoacyl-ACP reductase FabG [Deltaproteobacteria bacterium]
MLDGRVALVTGGGRGMGTAICRALARQGATVVINYRESRDRAEALAAEIIGAGGKALALQADVMDGEAVARMVEEARRQLGKLDILVHNAALLGFSKPFAQMTWADFELQVGISLKAAVHCAQAVLPDMTAQRWGRIVTMGTVMVNFPGAAGYTAYLAGKAALLGFTRSLAFEVGPLGVTVNMVAPTLTLTERIAAGPQDRIEAFARQIPVGRIPSPEDVAQAVTFLASPGAALITGVFLPVCGGMLML